MKLHKPVMIASLVAIVMPLAHAQTFHLGRKDLTAVKDTSNIFIVEQQHTAYVNHSNLDPDLYINSASISYGSNWDAGINMTFYGSGGDLGSYTFGTAITGDIVVDLTLTDLFAADAGVADGTYDFSVELFGGDSSSASNSLAVLDYTVLVRNDFRPTVTLNNIAPVAAGDTTTMSATVENNTGETIQMTGLWLDGGASTFFGVVPWNFDWSFYSGPVADGASQITAHSIWSPTATTPIGDYTVVAGILGGYTADDRFFVNSANNQILSVVPEPASMSVLGLGAAALLRRRKK